MGPKWRRQIHAGPRWPVAMACKITEGSVSYLGVDRWASPEEKRAAARRVPHSNNARGYSPASTTPTFLRRSARRAAALAQRAETGFQFQFLKLKRFAKLVVLSTWMSCCIAGSPTKASPAAKEAQRGSSRWRCWSRRASCGPLTGDRFGGLDIGSTEGGRRRRRSMRCTHAGARLHHVITHYQPPARLHQAGCRARASADGRIVQAGGPELALPAGKRRAADGFVTALPRRQLEA